jgi:hypothetical protein
MVTILPSPQAWDPPHVGYPRLLVQHIYRCPLYLAVSVYRNPYSLGVKRSRLEACHSPPYSTNVKNTTNYTSTLHYVFMAWYIVIKDRDNLRGRGTSVSIVNHATGHTTGVRFFLIATASRPLTQPLSNEFHWLLPWGKAAGAWNWSFTSIYCLGRECVELYLHSPNTS